MLFRDDSTSNDSYDSGMVSPRGLVRWDLLLDMTTVSDSSLFYLNAHPNFSSAGLIYKPLVTLVRDPIAGPVYFWLKQLRN
jgi:hypothetical protein